MPACCHLANRSDYLRTRTPRLQCLHVHAVTMPIVVTVCARKHAGCIDRTVTKLDALTVCTDTKPDVAIACAITMPLVVAVRKVG